MEKRQTAIKILPAAIMALFTAAALSIYLDISVYEPLTLLTVTALYVLFRKARKGSSRRARCAGRICGCLFAVLTVLGSYATLETRALYPLSFPICLAGFALLYSAVLTLAFSLGENFSLVDTSARDVSPKKLRRVFFTALTALFAWSLIWLAFEYPGNTTNDSLDQLRQAMGAIPLKSNHPAAHTLFVKLFFVTGLKIFRGDQNAALAFYIAFQALFMAAVFAYLIETLYKKRIKTPVLYAIAAALIAIPYYASYSITLWKDVLFSGLITVFCVTLWRLMGCKTERLPAWELMILYLSGLLAGVFRNMSYLAFFVMFPFVFALFRKKSLAAALMPLIVGGLAALICGPVYAMAGIAHNDALESRAIPLQHVACAITDGAQLSDAQREFLEKIMPVAEIPDNYYPNNADYIKELIREKGDAEFFGAHTAEFMELWRDVGRRYPASCLKAQIEQTKGYWFPDVSYWSMANFCASAGDLNIRKAPLLPESLVRVFEQILFYLNYMPVFGLVFSIGLGTWITVCLFALCIVKKQKKELVLFLPVLLLLATLCAVTPVFAEFRYAYSMFTTLPLLFVLPFASST
ncbi:MAG: DUF6020 family protein [Eubacteriales bacterium]|nr:DUF6020 family protein [Eubacteriales bacterium]